MNFYGVFNPTTDLSSLIPSWQVKAQDFIESYEEDRKIKISDWQHWRDMMRHREVRYLP